ncbi:efflux RND transporter permease subunit [Novosphingobium album (ex Liu et al. 2023)]|uniref:Efflux RND transporter permease subunit n=1 Tax=Novosphingobium album (ex Liu et al. 2023) TaxID=3031130 RepID=A0ABT5WLS9_9SPHN|nr:efflux RND transporter permease subunit [Novosphingobium album (ex Liu et al. 2023)]MDE8651003.1 efflux RND transporter permease subunit [Novosphingobium album (ex Liu et al. 2023)]
MSGFNLSALAVRERAVTLFVLIVVVVAGAFSFLNLGRAEDPTFTVKVLTVTAAWPGATAQDMQDLVAEPLEKRLQELEYYDRVETFTRPGLAFLTLTLKDSTPAKAVPDQFYQARKKLGDEAARLPQGALGPFINDEYSDTDFALYAVKARGMPPRELARHAERLRQRLLHVPGVTKVDLIGERPERIFVDFSFPKLATLGIPIGDVLASLARQNIVAPAGSVETSGPRVFVRLDGGYADLDQIRATPIVAEGRTLRLSDIATVSRGYEDPPTFLIRNGGEPAILLGIVMREGWNGLSLGKALEEEERAITRDLPLGLQLGKVSDQAVNIDEAVGEFMLKFFVALAVVMVVSLISLGWRVGIVVAAAVPLTLAAVFVVMEATGRVFDRITLGALILALGLLVDDAIIAIEMMVVKMEEGWERTRAAAFAWSSTAAPMLAGTLVTIIGLMPVGFARSSAGEYAGNIFWVVGFALIVSWIVAVTFTPYLGVRLLPAIEPVPGGHAAIYATPRYERFRAIVRRAIARKWLAGGAVVAAFLLAMLGMGLVKQQFFPVSERPELIAEIHMPEGSSITATDAATRKVERWLQAQPEAKVVTSYVGQGAPRFFLSLSPELPDPAFAKIIILTPDAKARDTLKARLRARIAAGLAPEARVRVTQLLFGPPVPYPVTFRVGGSDPDRLRAIAGQVTNAMRANPNMRQVNTDWGDLVPTAHFVLDQARLRAIGLDPQAAAQQLQLLLSGVPVTQVREDIRTAVIEARATGAQRLDPARLADLSLTTADGRSVPLDQIGRIEYRPEAPILKRRDRVPTITVRGDIDERLQPAEVSAQVEKALAPIRAALPQGYSIDTGGAVEEAAKANTALGAVFPMMILAMLAVIMIEVRSFGAMAMVFLTAPLGLVGAVPTLLLFQQPFGFNAILGMIGLGGILMRNTLILIGQIDDNQQAGLSPLDAIVEATVQRARPVLLTALAAVLAFIPLTTSSFWGPMAFVLIGGTAIGTVLTLLFLPALYAIWFRIGRD